MKMFFLRLGQCHTCGNPKGARAAWCSIRCEKRAVIHVGDMVVLDSGYTPGENGIPFKAEASRVRAGQFRGRVRGKWVEFIKEQAAKVGTKRAESIINKRKLNVGGANGK